MKLNAKFATHVGYKRSNNEDRCFVDLSLGLFIVCDGVGGNMAGERAAELAIEAVRDYLTRHKDTLEHCKKNSTSIEEIYKMGASSVRYACQVVYEEGKKNVEFQNMACTLTMALQINEQILVCHVGDSRLYIVNSRGDFLMTEDHTVARQLFNKGIIDKEEPPLSNVLARCIGQQEMVDVDCLLLDLTSSDRVLICSDGISNCFDKHASLRSLIQGTTLHEALERLINNSLIHGGLDNSSAIIIELEEAGDEEELMFTINQLTLEVMSECAIFKGLNLAQLTKLKAFSSTGLIQENEIFCESHEAINGLYLVIDGVLDSEDALYNRGDFWGVKALISKDFSSDEKTALYPTRLQYLSKKQFEKYMMRYPRAANKILKNLLLYLIQKDTQDEV